MKPVKYCVISFMVAMTICACEREVEKEYFRNVVVGIGSNQNGQLGKGDNTDATEPFVNIGLNDILDVEAGAGFGMALAENGKVFTWGSNSSGCLGVGAATRESLIPLMVEEISGVKKIQANYHTCMALDENGKVWTWGFDPGDAGTTYTPAMVDLDDIVDIACGYFHCVAVASDGSVYSWGENVDGQLGDGTYYNRSTPGKVDGLPKVTQITCGRSHTIALTEEGEVYAWGRNDLGQLGIGTYADRSSPNRLNTIEDVVAVFAGYNQGFCITSPGDLLAWGENNVGQLGTDSYAYRSAQPSPVPGITGVADVDTRNEVTIASTSDGRFFQWGACYVNQGTWTSWPGYYPVPEKVEMFSGIAAIANGITFYLVVKTKTRP